MGVAADPDTGTGDTRGWLDALLFVIITLVTIWPVDEGVTALFNGPCKLEFEPLIIVEVLGLGVTSEVDEIGTPPKRIFTSPLFPEMFGVTALIKFPPVFKVFKLGKVNILVPLGTAVEEGCTIDTVETDGEATLFPTNMAGPPPGVFGNIRNWVGPPLFELVTQVLTFESSSDFVGDTVVMKLHTVDCTLLFAVLESLRRENCDILGKVLTDAKLLPILSEFSEFKSHLSNEMSIRSWPIVSLFAVISILKLSLVLTLTVSDKTIGSSSWPDDKFERNDKLDSFISTLVFGENSARQKQSIVKKKNETNS